MSERLFADDHLFHLQHLSHMVCTRLELAHLNTIIEPPQRVVIDVLTRIQAWKKQFLDQFLCGCLWKMCFGDVCMISQ